MLRNFFVSFKLFELLKKTYDVSLQEQRLEFLLVMDLRINICLVLVEMYFWVNWTKLIDDWQQHVPMSLFISLLI